MTAPAFSQQVIKIGVVGALTGTFAAVGQSQVDRRADPWIERDS